MSAPENFFSRWSRRKRADSPSAPPTASTVTTTVTNNPDGSTSSAAQAPTPSATQGAPPQAEPPFNISKLPPIESITAQTDIRSFLAPGVPAELARAALRRAWAADPAIRDFVGLSENSWDFNSPGAIPGFGPLEMTDELRRRIAEMVGRSLATQALEEPAAEQGVAVARPSIETAAKSVAEPSSDAMHESHGVARRAAEGAGEMRLIDARDNKVSEQNPTHVAAQQKHAAIGNQSDAVPKRTHGRALPK